MTQNFLRIYTNEPQRFSQPNLSTKCVFRELSPINNIYLHEKCSDAADDNTFICDYHLEKYFFLRKFVVNLFGDDTRTKQFGERLCVVSVLDQNEVRRLHIPKFQNYVAAFDVENLSVPEKLVFYSIYNDTARLKAECDKLNQTRNYGQKNIMEGLVANTNKVLQTITTNETMNACSQQTSVFTRTWEYMENNNYNPLENQPVFIQNLINRLITPRFITIADYTYRFLTSANCLWGQDGLISDALYNRHHQREDTMNVQITNTKEIYNVEKEKIKKSNKQVIHINHVLMNGIETVTLNKR